jgi:hypothetical protein
VAFASLELLRADCRIGRDCENQIVDLWLITPIILVSLEANNSVLLVGYELERTSADRNLIEIVLLTVRDRYIPSR